MPIMEGISKVNCKSLSVEKRVPHFYWMIVLSVFLGFSVLARAEDNKSKKAEPKQTKTVYPKKTELDFEGAQIEGELRNPGDFYFQHRPEEKFDSLVKRRKNFHREMMRDVVFSK